MQLNTLKDEVKMYKSETRMPCDDDDDGSDYDDDDNNNAGVGGTAPVKCATVPATPLQSCTESETTHTRTPKYATSCYMMMNCV